MQPLTLCLREFLLLFVAELSPSFASRFKCSKYRYSPPKMPKIYVKTAVELLEFPDQMQVYQSIFSIIFFNQVKANIQFKQLRRTLSMRCTLPCQF